MPEREVWGRPIESQQPLAHAAAAGMMGSAEDVAPGEPAVVDPLEGTDTGEFGADHAAPEDTASHATEDAFVGETKTEDSGPDGTPAEERRPDETPGW